MPAKRVGDSDVKGLGFGRQVGDQSSREPALRSFQTRQVLLGSLAMTAGWVCHGLSLWCTLEGLGTSPTSDCAGRTLAGLTAAFVLMAPSAAAQ